LKKNNVKPKLILKRNLAIALLLSKSKHTHLQLNTVLINEVKLSNLVILNSQFGDVEFKNVKLSETLFEECQEIKLKVQKGSFGFTDFKNSYVNLELFDFSANKVLFSFCGQVRIQGEQCNFNDLTVEGTKITGSGSFAIENSNFKNSQLQYPEINHQTFFATVFEKVHYSIKKGNIVNVKQCTIQNSTLIINSKDITFSPSKIYHTDITLSGKSQIEQSAWDHCVAEFNGTINLNNSRFEHVSFEEMDDKTRFIFTKNELVNCSFIVLSINAENIRDFLKNKFLGSRGVVFVKEIQGKTKLVKFNKYGAFKQKDMYYLDYEQVKLDLTDDFKIQVGNSIANENDFKIFMQRFGPFNQM